MARVSPTALAAAVADRDVVGISSDAPMRGLANGLLKTLGTVVQNITNPVDLTAGLVSTQSSHLLNTLALTTTTNGLSLLNSNTGAGIGIAVLDSGLDQNAVSLDNVTYYDAVGGSVTRVNGRADGYGHGTHVAGLLASNGSSSSGLYRGVAMSARVIAVRVLDDNGQGRTSDVVNALNFVVANRESLGVRIVSMSLGHPIFEPASRDPLVTAVQRAVASGIVVVVSAGNYGGDPVTHATGYAGITSPGNAPGAITVGATETFQTDDRRDDEVAWYSSRGPSWYDGFQKPDVVAPGSHLVSNISTTSTISSRLSRRHRARER
ncbi:MAG: S8 family serine peptidase [Vicinamibacterales bacterium]